MSDHDQDDGTVPKLLAQAAFGIEVEAFLGSDIGRYLIARAEAEREQALNALKDVDAEDSRAIRQLQSTVARAESIQYWMAEAIQEGRNAERQLEGLDE